MEIQIQNQFVTRRLVQAKKGIGGARGDRYWEWSAYAVEKSSRLRLRLKLFAQVAAVVVSHNERRVRTAVCPTISVNEMAHGIDMISTCGRHILMIMWVFFFFSRAATQVAAYQWKKKTFSRMTQTYISHKVYRVTPAASAAEHQVLLFSGRRNRDNEMHSAWRRSNSTAMRSGIKQRRQRRMPRIANLSGRRDAATRAYVRRWVPAAAAPPLYRDRAVARRPGGTIWRGTPRISDDESCLRCRQSSRRTGSRRGCGWNCG